MGPLDSIRPRVITTLDRLKRPEVLCISLALIGLGLAITFQSLQTVPLLLACSLLMAPFHPKLSASTVSDTPLNEVRS